jgi:phage shock protein E
MRLLTLLLSSLFLVGAGCKPSARTVAQLEPPVTTLPDSVRLLDPASARTLIQNDTRLQIIDCRGEDEFIAGHLPRARHANYFTPDVARERLAALDPSRPTLVYCALGERSRRVALILLDLGHQDVRLLEGGVHAWLSAGLPLDR